MSNRFTEGINGDGVVILDNGLIISISEILQKLNKYDSLIDEKPNPTIKTGIDYIKNERIRQIKQEGWSLKHDQTYTSQELARAACYYAVPPHQHQIREAIWPERWDKKWKKPSNDRVRELSKAGALIAAEIDRINKVGEHPLKPLSQLTEEDAIKIAEAATGLKGWELSAKGYNGDIDVAISDKIHFSIRNTGEMEFCKEDDEYLMIQDECFYYPARATDKARELGYDV